MYSNNRGDLLGSSTDRDMHREHTKRRGIQKYLRESWYHHIECAATTILRRLMNSTALVTTTHRKPKRVSDGKDTQIRVQITNKCRIKMIWRELYNVRDLPWERGIEKIGREHCSNLNCLCIQLWSIYTSVTSSDWKSIYIKISYLCLIVI